ncbi:MAG: DUF896 domain-containing protein [Clostridia bacterium]|nr:DUF896 domain-containing protein [Clostridia bacterium]
MEQSRIDRLNELARLKKERELTVEEQAEQAELRNEYLAAIRMNLEAQLENTVVVYPDGTRKKLARKDKPFPPKQ